MATITSNASGAWATGATWVGGSAPADGDAVVIAEGHNILMDADLSAYTGLLTVTITSHATTPGMLYFANGTSGYLKLRTGYNIVGTNAAAKGRLLANSNGTWGATGALAFANKAVIDLQGTAKIDAQYLDIALYCTEPTNKYVEVYKTAYTCTTQTTDVNASTDVITFTGAPPSAGTAVKVRSSGTLPGGLTTTDLYYTRTISGNTCKLALQNSDASIVDITNTGSGTLTMYDGHTDTGTATVNVIQDVTGDGPWITTDGHDKVVLCDIGLGADYQGLQLTTINTGSLVLSANVNSVQYPLARVFLMSRNVSIRASVPASTPGIVDYASAYSASGVFGCEIYCSTGYGTGINYGTGHTISGTLHGMYNGIGNLTNGTISGVIANQPFLVASSSGVTISGVLAATSDRAINGGTNMIISGEIVGCATAIYNGYGCTVSGKIIGCGTAFTGGSNNDVSGQIANCSGGFSASFNNLVSGEISGCANVFSQTTNSYLSGTINGCNYGFSNGAGHVITGTIKKSSTAAFYHTSFVAIGMTLTANSIDITYSGVNSGRFTRSRSFRHAGTANDTRAWSAGGAMTHETSEVPSGKSYSHKFTHVDGSYWTVMEWEINRPSGSVISEPVWAKHDSTGLSGDQLLRWELIDIASDPILGGTALATWTDSDSASWQSSSITYTKTDDRPLLLRVSAKRASGNSYAYVEPEAVAGPLIGYRTGGLR